MSRFSSLPPVGRLYVSLVTLAGVAAIIDSAIDIAIRPFPFAQWLILAALTLLSGSIAVKVPSVPATISVSEAFVFTAVLLFGVSAGTATVALDGLVISLWLRRKNPGFHRIVFNISAPSAAIWLSAQLFFWLAGSRPLSFPGTTPVHVLLLPLAAFTVSYFLLNSWLIALAISLERGLSAARIWTENFFWLSVNFFGGASVAALLVAYTRQISASAVGVIVPLIVISYLTYKTSMARLEDATRHYAELNELYLSTIETLAMAIDAKDQVTHGHIRRVQLNAVGLARHLGLRDPSLLAALEAAALLHDIGKIGVPEHILNKPGKLSPAEFEQMKLHASLGGDLVATIHYRNLVAPIVRHHHENWDGSGYPDGLAGTSIPIGARILAVVDCYDALTSDRPYRRRLDQEEALAILKERRGTMYDPLVVDTFLRVFPELSKECTQDATTDLAPRPASLSPAATIDEWHPAIPVGWTVDESDDVFSLLETIRRVGGKVGSKDIGAILARHLVRVTGASTCLLFLPDGTHETLCAVCAHGIGEDRLLGLRIPVGRNISGWVAATRRSVVNGEAAVDLGPMVHVSKPELASCLSVALDMDGVVLGVVSLYSREPLAFSEDHRRLMELILGQIAGPFRDSLEFDRQVTSSARDPVTGLPYLHVAHHVVSNLIDRQRVIGSPVTVVFFVPIDLETIFLPLGASSRASTLRLVAKGVRDSLRSADMLFWSQDNEMAALLLDTDRVSGDAIARRIASSILADPVMLPNGAVVTLRFSWGIASQPEDGCGLDELAKAARDRARLHQRTQGHSSLLIH